MAALVAARRLGIVVPVFQQVLHLALFVGRLGRIPRARVGVLLHPRRMAAIPADETLGPLGCDQVG